MIKSSVLTRSASSHCSNVEATKESLGGDGDENELQEVKLAISLPRESFISCSSFSSFTPHRSLHWNISLPVHISCSTVHVCVQTARRHPANGQPISCKEQNPCIASADGTLTTATPPPRAVPPQEEGWHPRDPQGRRRQAPVPRPYPEEVDTLKH